MTFWLHAILVSLFLTLNVGCTMEVTIRKSLAIGSNPNTPISGLNPVPAMSQKHVVDSFQVGLPQSFSKPRMVRFANGNILIAGSLKLDGANRVYLKLYQPNGELLASFGTAGNHILPATLGTVDSMDIQTDGKILLLGDAGGAGNISVVTDLPYSYVARLNSDGTLDTSFAGQGFVILDEGLVGGNTFHSAKKILSEPSGLVYVQGVDSNYQIYVARFDANGDLDVGFASTGYLIAPETGVSASLALQGDGKLIFGATAAGYNGLSISRYNLNGTLDGTFGTGGRVTAFGGQSNTLGLGLLSDGRIVSVGYHQGSNAGYVALFTAAGALDTNFGGTGFVIYNPTAHADSFRAVTIQSNDKIVVATDLYNAGLYVARYHVNGNLDTSFAGTGSVVLDAVGTANSYPYEILSDPDDNILISGITTMPFVFHNMVVFKLGVNGARDATFGDNGQVVTADIVDTTSKSTDSVQAMERSIDGRLVVAGTTFNNKSYKVGVLRYLLNGEPDLSFGPHGRRVVDVGVTSVDAVVIQSDNKVLILGNEEISNDQTETYLIRLQENGELDLQFNGTGFFKFSLYDLHVDFGTTIFNEMVLQTDGKIVMVASNSGSGEGRGVILRVNTDGTLDSDFGTAGMTVFAPDTNWWGFEGLHLMPDGSLLAVGGSDDGAVIARFTSTGALDTTFNATGYVVIADMYFANDIVIRSNGQIVLAGRGQVAQLSSAGILDTNFGTNGVLDLSEDGMLVDTDMPTSVSLLPDGNLILMGIAYDMSYTYAAIFIKKVNSMGVEDPSFFYYHQLLRPDPVGNIANLGRSPYVGSNGAILAAGTADAGRAFVIQIDGHVQ